MAWNVSVFRQTFPAFASETKYPDAMLDTWRTMAECQLVSTPCHGDGCYDMALMLMVAHIAALQTLAAKGKSPTGIVTSATIDKVNVGFSVPPYNSAWQFWLSQTPYGQQLQAMLASCVVGGMYVGGLPESSAFRKVYGVF